MKDKGKGQEIFSFYGPRGNEDTETRRPGDKERGADLASPCLLVSLSPCLSVLSSPFSPVLSPLACLVLALTFLAFPARADEKDAEKSATKLVTPAADRAIDLGLKWLVAEQHDDGGIGSGPSRGNVAICALAGMAMMSEGSTPGRGSYGGPLNRCVDYLLAASQPSGFIVGPDAGHGPMYGHGFATMFLAECYGMSPRGELRDKLSKAVKIIIGSENKDGGWRYHRCGPTPTSPSPCARSWPCGRRRTPDSSCPTKRSAMPSNTSGGAKTPMAASCI